VRLMVRLINKRMEGHWHDNAGVKITSSGEFEAGSLDSYVTLYFECTDRKSMVSLVSAEI